MGITSRIDEPGFEFTTGRGCFSAADVGKPVFMTGVGWVEIKTVHSDRRVTIGPRRPWWERIFLSWVWRL